MYGNFISNLISLSLEFQAGILIPSFLQGSLIKCFCFHFFKIKSLLPPTQKSCLESQHLPLAKAPDHPSYIKNEFLMLPIPINKHLQGFYHVCVFASNCALSFRFSGSCICLQQALSKCNQKKNLYSKVKIQPNYC